VADVSSLSAIASGDSAEGGTFVRYLVADITGDPNLFHPGGLARYVHVVFCATPALPATLFCKLESYRSARLDGVVIFPLRCRDIIAGDRGQPLVIEEGEIAEGGAATPRVGEMAFNAAARAPEIVSW
jgi:hypothetical protein